MAQVRPATVRAHHCAAPKWFEKPVSISLCGLPRRLPPDLRQRHKAFYDRAMQSAREEGWDPELGDDE